MFAVLGDDLAADMELMESRNLIRSDGNYQRFCKLYQASFLYFLLPLPASSFMQKLYTTHREKKY
jgi:hypothetical protein